MVNNSRIRSQKRKIFTGKKGTLNDRLGAGITAENKWFDNFLLKESALDIKEKKNDEEKATEHQEEI